MLITPHYHIHSKNTFWKYLIISNYNSSDDITRLIVLYKAPICQRPFRSDEWRPVSSWNDTMTEWLGPAMTFLFLICVIYRKMLCLQSDSVLIFLPICLWTNRMTGMAKEGTFFFLLTRLRIELLRWMWTYQICIMQLN